jgi:hypothetical protein
LIEISLPSLRSLALTVNATWQRRLIAHVLGHTVPSKSWFDEISALCSKQGVDLKKWLLPKDELSQLVDEDDWRLAVQKALLVIPNTKDRLTAESEIFRAFNHFLSSQARRDLARMRGKH